MLSFAHFSLFCALNREIMSKNIAIFASGSGTNAANIIHCFADNPSVRVSLVVTNRPDAYVLERVRPLGVPGVYVPGEAWVEGGAVLSLLRDQAIDFIVLAGFLKRVPACLLQAYPDRIVNIHPALLPKFGGRGMYGDHVHRAVLEAGEAESGITIHYINEHYDEGAVIAQFRCPVLPGDTVEELATRVHALEYEHYPEVIGQVLSRI